MESVLQIRNLNKSFKRHQVIKNISLDVYAGEVFGFLGPNGAGKTTTIKMVMGFLFPDSGEIIINDINLKKNYEKAMVHLGGIVENPEMYKDISGMANLKMYARLHKGVTKERIQEVVDMVGMTNFIHNKVGRYSLGMKQRVGLAQALLHKPKLLILDEPTNGLDPVGIRELRDILKKLAHEEGVAIIVSSHMLSEMQLMCDRVGIIGKGELISVKPIEELLNQATGGSVYKIITKQGEEAGNLLKTNYTDIVNEITPEYILLTIEENQIPEIIKLLATNGIAIYGAGKNEVSLEDAYMNATGGGNVIV